jgi:hypothetical protein
MSKTIWTALHAAKQELGKVPKDSTNPFFKSKYFDINGLLDVAEPILHKHGLFIIQPITNGKVVTKIVHAESGESIESELELSDTKDPQKHGSEITYYRRYTLQSLLAMQADDDDGNAASKGAQKPAAQPAKQALTPTHEKWTVAVEALAAGKVQMPAIEAKYLLTAENRLALIEAAAEKEAANA